MSTAAEWTGYLAWLVVAFVAVCWTLDLISQTQWWYWHHETFSWKRSAPWKLRWAPVRVRRYKPPLEPRSLALTIPWLGKVLVLMIHRTDTCKQIGAAQKAARRAESPIQPVSYPSVTSEASD